MAIIHSLKCTVPFSFVVPLAVTCCHLLFLLSLAIIRCHSLSLVVPLVAIRCTTRCHSLSHVVPLVVTRCHSLSLVVIRCHSLSFVVTRCTTRCHSLSLDVPLACLFRNDLFLNYGELPDKKYQRTIHIHKIKKVNLCNNLSRYIRSFENWFNMIGILA